MESSFISNQPHWYTCKCGHAQCVSVRDVEEQYQYEHELSTRLKEIYGPIGTDVLLEEYSANMAVEIQCGSCQKRLTVIVEVNGRPMWIYSDDDMFPIEPWIDNFSDIRILRVLPNDSQFGYSLDRFIEESSEEPEYDYFPDIEPDLEDSQEGQFVNLKVIVKTSMIKGFCHLGFDFQSGKFLRPLYRSQEGRCCWDEPLEIDQMYDFTILRSPGDWLDAKTPLPHSNEDLLVEHRAIPIESSATRLETFQELMKIAKSSVIEIFGSGIKQHKYVDEDTNCPSVGVLMCEGRDLKLVRDSFEYRKKRNIKIGEYSFRITAFNATELPEDLPDLPTLVILGLARPFVGTRPRHFKPRRCYILALRILQYPFVNSSGTPIKRPPSGIGQVAG